ncbi:MAG TPA: ferritin-like domain-containing protein [Rhodanobacteraceae bacterium]|nr:ferritin-like domain-containing protein [Rhodanobacteraceae bacterium]
MTAESLSLHELAARCVYSATVAEKLALTTAVAAHFASGDALADAVPVSVAQLSTEPGRPDTPRRVAPRNLPRRGLASAEGRAALVHAVAHIEFNAINLAWDAVSRFRGMPADYYRDWVGVAVDEARHFKMLSERLAELGHAYGDFDAHDGLWEMAVKTADSCLARMALVPRVLEARGLDVTPGMIARLRAAGDEATAAILEVILREEVAHVAAGSRWFVWCCERERSDPATTFEMLIRTHLRGALRGPFNIEARLRAGFTEAELAQLSDAEKNNGAADIRAQGRSHESSDELAA